MTQLRHKSPIYTQFRFKLPSDSILRIEQLQSLNIIEGVIDTDVKSHSVIIHYDLMQTDLNVLMATLNENNIELAMGPLQKLRANLKRFTDQNMRDHSNHQHQCCGKPPKER